MLNNSKRYSTIEVGGWHLAGNRRLKIKSDRPILQILNVFQKKKKEKSGLGQL